ncbi:MAG: heat-inducible transcription repressor HrcA [Anaerolineae bacterium]|nr:heat-inducible transcription repressor HrcA [Anaerolineae bacterium]
MTEPSKRQEYILGLIVREYVKEPTPVSSKALVECYGLDFSSATIRNDMAALEEMGLITSPHTSAGRVPTEAGYRYFVQKLIGDSELLPAEQRMIRHQFHQSRLDVEQWLQLAASVLAQTARTASLVTAPATSPARFKHLELISTHGRLVLMILVLECGDVRQQMLTLAEPVTQERLSEIAAQINSQCVETGSTQMRAKAAHQPPLDQEIIELAAELLEQADQQHRIIYSDGLVNILDPSYLLDRLEITDPNRRDDLTKALMEADSSGARQTLRLLQEHSLLEAILGEVLSSDIQGVRVMIGGEGRWEELSHTSMVLSRYGVHGYLTGTLGVLGPTRLHYGRAISAVRYVASLITDMMIEVYGEGNQPL